MHTERADTNGKHKLTAGLVILLAGVLFIVGGIVIGMNWNSWFSKQASVPNADLDPGAVSWSGSLPQSGSGDEKGIAIPGYPSIAIPAGETDVRVALTNPEENPCYFTFELVLKDTGESLYTSRMVEPGKALTSITLSRPLEAGAYDAFLRITTHSLTDLSGMNGANVATRLVVS
ncbi:hypothetical protein [Candidatus Soleaferrea massiliensis]|uniref:hypothetical protein n=1 Tax=Candidatus Soleaferrea massiliensis TaxID=1470354 RepID=UPI000694F36A|nr:hypothetical protein [Candidatus Soleaferrea massiliensis]